jgi:Fic family protein
MNPKEFNTKRAGEIFEYQDEGETVVTFLPSPLPPEIHYEEEMVRLVEEAASNLNDLKGTGRNLPNPNIFIQPYILKEAVVSSQIEGTRTSFEEAVIQADEEVEDTRETRDLQEVRNYAEALEYGMDRLEKEPLTVDLIRRIHEKLMSGVRGEERSPGEFRDKQVHIGEIGVSREDAEFVPMPPEKIEDAMEELIEFIQEDHSMPYLVKSALIHYQFETIHPFEDGNGRMGRLLIILDMLNKDKLTQPLLYLSEYFNNNKIRYYEKLQNVREKGEYEEWIKFYFRAVKNQSKKSTETAVKILDKKEDYRNKLRERGVPENCMILMEQMFDLRSRTISDISEELDVSYHTARSYIRALREENIAEELERDGREQHYILGEILDMMDEQSPEVIQN